jgi:hypothetical protein
VQVWLVYPGELESEGSADLAREVLDIHRPGFRVYDTHQVALACSFQLLDHFLKSKSQFVPYVYRSIILSLIGDHTKDEGVSADEGIGRTVALVLIAAPGWGGYM